MQTLATTPASTTPIQAIATELKALWARHEVLDDPSLDAAQQAEFSDVCKRIAAAEEETLTTPIQSAADAAFKCSIIQSFIGFLPCAFYDGDVDVVDVLELATSDLASFLARSTCAVPATTSVYWDQGYHDQLLKKFHAPKPVQQPPLTIRQQVARSVRRIRFIKQAQELGFSLKEIKEILSLQSAPHSSGA